MEQVKEIEEKQKYLVNEIMNQNYDPQRFSDYISNFKENGTDLNNWTFAELKEIVASFKSIENSAPNNIEENIEKEVENVRNSFILSRSDTERKFELSNDKNKTLLKNNHDNNNNFNPYNQILDENEDVFQNIENIMSDLDKEDQKKNNNIWSEIGDFEIIDSSEFIDNSKDKLICIKQKENSLLKYNNLNVYITG
jgi:hypothetical protein